MNETIQHQLNHRSIRKFKAEKISSDIIQQLLQVAQRTASSNFMQSYSLINVTDPVKQAEFAEICAQPYVAEASHLFIFVADQHRNAQIAEENGQETSVLHNMDRFMVAMTDAVLAAQNVTNAAESLGIGTVFLGSILNDSRKVIQLLNLPELTFPVLGLAIGYPDQEPELKPRLPQEFVVFENEYQQIQNLNAALGDYDAVVSEYYDLRNMNRKIDSFTKQITEGMNRKPPKRLAVLKEIQAQGFIKE